MSQHADDIDLPDMRRAPVSVSYWANRFGELCNEGEPDAPQPEKIEEIIERLYPHNDDGLELAHVVTLDGVLGILLEYEFGGGYVPSTTVWAHWAMQAPRGVRFLCYSGLGTFDDCWQFAAFIPAEGFDRATVERCASSMIAWGAKA